MSQAGALETKKDASRFKVSDEWLSKETLERKNAPIHSFYHYSPSTFDAHYLEEMFCSFLETFPICFPIHATSFGDHSTHTCHFPIEVGIMSLGKKFYMNSWQYNPQKVMIFVDHLETCQQPHIKLACIHCHWQHCFNLLVCWIINTPRCFIKALQVVNWNWLVWLKLNLSWKRNKVHCCYKREFGHLVFWVERIVVKDEDQSVKRCWERNSVWNA